MSGGSEAMMFAEKMHLAAAAAVVVEFDVEVELKLQLELVEPTTARSWERLLSRAHQQTPRKLRTMKTTTMALPKAGRAGRGGRKWRVTPAPERSPWCRPKRPSEWSQGRGERRRRRERIDGSGARCWPPLALHRANVCLPQPPREHGQTSVKRRVAGAQEDHWRKQLGDMATHEPPTRR